MSFGYHNADPVQNKLNSTLAFLNTNESAISIIKCHLDIYSLGGKHILQLFSTCPSLFSGIC